jgi:hypothetical protein
MYPVVRVTIDTNVLIALEQGAPRDAAPLRLVRLHREGRIRINVPAIIASEQPHGGGEKWAPFSRFQERLANVGLADAEIVMPMCYWGISYLDHCWSVTDPFIEQERRIHEVLFPGVLFDYPAYCAARDLASEPTARDPKWVNRKCDVQVLWSHLHAECDVLLTSDEKFHQATKKVRLLDMGAGKISRPEEFVASFPA